MGNTQSTDPELLKLQKRFSASELQELEHLFLSLAAQSRTGGTHIIASVFQAYFGIHGALGSRLFAYITRNDSDELLSFEEFIAAKAVVDKGDDEELQHFTFAMGDVLQNGRITRYEADAVVTSALLTVFGPDTAPLSRELIAAFLNSAEFKGPHIDLGTPHPLCRQCSSRKASGRETSGQETSGRDVSGRHTSAQDISGRGASGQVRSAGWSPSHIKTGQVQAEGMFRVGSELSSGAESLGHKALSEAGSSLHGSETNSMEQVEEKMNDLWSGSSESLTHLGEQKSACNSGRDCPQRNDKSSNMGAEQCLDEDDADSYGSGQSASAEEESDQTEAGGTAGGTAGEEGGECTSECGKQPSFIEEDFKAYMERIPVLKKFLRTLLAPPSVAKTLSGRLVPALELPKGVNPSGGLSFRKGGRFLMSSELAWHLSGMLQGKEAEGPWRLAYSSSLHGLSFSTFMGRVGDIPVPGALVVRDKAGSMFGAVFSRPLHRKSAFFGDMKSFLFTFLPAAAVYKPSGLNQNIQWCATNFASESIPNGVGFGGQIGHYGLFLDSTLDKGHSWPCMTFRSPCLSGEPLFDVDVVECWSLGQPDADEEGNASGTKKPQLKGTVLERFKEEKALLGSAGMATSSDNLSKEDTS